MFTILLIVAKTQTWTRFIIPITVTFVVLAVLFLVYACIYVLPQRIERVGKSKDDLQFIKGLSIKDIEAEDRYRLAQDHRKLLNDIRTTLLQGIAGGVLLLGLVFTWQQQRGINDQLAVAQRDAATAEQGLVTERFKEGINELGSPKDYVRAGGVYTLVRVAKESSSDTANAAYTVVLTFVRDNLCRNKNSNATLNGDADFVGPPQSVVSGLQTLHDKFKLDRVKIDLSHLRGCQGNLGADLVNVDLNEVNLTDAHFSGATLEGANLTKANLHCANLHGTNFDHGTNFTDSKLLGADISNDSFKHAKGFTRRQLQEAYWDRALKSEGDHLPEVPRPLQGLVNRGPSKAAIDAYTACQKNPNA
jgi:hypothetical protein